MIREEDVYKIGKIGKPHGVRGEVSFHFTDDVFDRVESEYVFLMIDGILVPFFMEEYRFRSEETVLLKFEDIDTVERAAELTGTEVFFPRELADLEEEEISWQQLVGYDLVDHNSRRKVGRIAGVDCSTENVVVETEDGSMFPAADELIKEIDKEKRTLTLIIPEGLIGLN